ncbi:MAG: hypothetical protein WCG91_04210 [Candidatus Shapirobacteria bacterium]
MTNINENENGDCLLIAGTTYPQEMMRKVSVGIDHDIALGKDIKVREKKTQNSGPATIAMEELLHETNTQYTEIKTKELGEEFRFVESHYEETLGYDYNHPLGGGAPVRKVKRLPSYGCLMNKEGEQLTELVVIAKDTNNNCLLLDDKNIIIPVINSKRRAESIFMDRDNALHYRVENGKVELINSFFGYFGCATNEKIASQKMCTLSIFSEDKLGEAKTYLYSYLDGKILSNSYTRIYQTKEEVKTYFNDNHLIGPALIQIMNENDWLLGKIKISSDFNEGKDVKVYRSTEVFGFIGLDGLPVTDLFTFNKDNEVIKYPIDRTIEANTKAEKKIKTELNRLAKNNINITLKELKLCDNFKQAMLGSVKTF